MPVTKLPFTRRRRTPAVLAASMKCNNSLISAARSSEPPPKRATNSSMEQEWIPGGKCHNRQKKVTSSTESHSFLVRPLPIITNRWSGWTQIMPVLRESWGTGEPSPVRGRVSGRATRLLTQLGSPVPQLSRQNHNALLPHQEILRIHQRPQQIFQRRPPVLGSPMRHQSGAFRRRRQPAEGCQKTVHRR